MNTKLQKEEQLKILRAVLANMPSEYEKIIHRREEGSLKDLETSLNESL